MFHALFTGVLQVDMGYIAANEYAWDLCCQLIHETVKTAAAAGLNFDEEKSSEKVKNTPSTIQTAVLLSAQTCVMAEEQKLIPSAAL